MPLSKRIYNCPICGYKADRDLNASINILKRATVGLTGSYVCGDSSSTPLARVEQGVSLKQKLNTVRT
jgi:putative transposase